MSKPARTLPNDTNTHESMVAPVASPAGTVPDLDAEVLEGGAQPSGANGAGEGDATLLEETGDGSAPGAPEAAPPPGLALAWARVVESVRMSGHPPEEIARVVELRERDILALTRELMDVRDVLFDAEVDQGHNAIGVRKLVEERDLLRAELAEAQAENARIDNRASDLLAEFRGALRRALDIPAGDWSSEELVTMVDAFRTEVVEELDRAGTAPGATLDRLTAAMDEIVRHRAAQLDSATAFADRLNREAGEKLGELLDAAGIAPGGALDRVERALLDLRAYRERVFAPTPLATRFARVIEVGGAAGRRCGVNLELDGQALFIGLDQARAKAVAPLLFEDVTLSISRGPFARPPESSPLDGDDDIPL